MARPGDGSKAHLGEAETVAIMANRFSDCFFVTDDSGAKIVARQQGLRVISTWDLLRACVKAQCLTEDEAWHDIVLLRDLGRGQPAGVYNHTSFLAWLK